MAQASSLLIASAPADGIGPCALLGACVRTPQLLVNVPEGFARLVLEHRVRPSAKLAAVVLTHLRPDAAVRAWRESRLQGGPNESPECVSPSGGSPSPPPAPVC
jgi:hypothetical protein